MHREEETAPYWDHYWCRLSRGGSPEVKVSRSLRGVSRQAGGGLLISAERAVMDGRGRKTRSHVVYSQ